MNEPWGETEEGEFTNCPGCGQRVSPDDATAVYAVELREIGPTFGGPAEPVEGMGAFFHPDCLNARSRKWRRTQP
jgi:hypothetical protein